MFPHKLKRAIFTAHMWFAVNCVNYLACILKIGHMCAEKVVENRIWQKSSFFFFFPCAMEK